MKDRVQESRCDKRGICLGQLPLERGARIDTDAEAAHEDCSRNLTGACEGFAHAFLGFTGPAKDDKVADADPGIDKGAACLKNLLETEILP
jgi:hypothetical protein